MEKLTGSTGAFSDYLRKEWFLLAGEPGISVTVKTDGKESFRQT